MEKRSSLDANNKYANLKYEKQKIHKTRLAGKVIYLVSNWHIRHVAHPKRFTKHMDRLRRLVGVRCRRILIKLEGYREK